MTRDIDPRPPADDPRMVVGPVVRDLTARRLARAGIPLVLVTFLGVAGLVLDTGPLWVGVVAGGPVAALALLAQGMRGVGRAYGAKGGGWAAVPGSIWLVPWAYGLYVLGWPGLLRLQEELTAGRPLGAGVALLFVVLGFLLLRTSSRVGEVARLGGVMGTPDRGEAAP